MSAHMSAHARACFGSVMLLASETEYQHVKVSGTTIVLRFHIILKHKAVKHQYETLRSCFLICVIVVRAHERSCARMCAHARACALMCSSCERVIDAMCGFQLKYHVFVKYAMKLFSFTF